MLVYIASPYSNGDTCENVRRACLAGDRLLAAGITPLIPHLFHLYHLISPKPYETWMELGMNYLSMCDALLRLPGESKGADREVAQAKEWGILVYYDIDTLIEGAKV